MQYVHNLNTSKLWMLVALPVCAIGALTHCGGSSDDTKYIRPTFNTHPLSQTSAVGKVVTFSAEATGKPDPVYQWFKGKKDATGAVKYEPISSETRPSISYTPTQGDDGIYFQVHASNKAGKTPSNEAILTLEKTLNITSQPKDQSLLIGQDATFSVEALSSSQPTFQWQENGLDIPNATQKVLTVPNVQSQHDGFKYTVVVSSQGLTQKSQAAVLRVKNAALPPSILENPQSLSVMAGESARFQVKVSGIPMPTIQWRRNEVNINGANGSTYDIPTTSLNDHGAKFDVEVANASGTLYSQAATLSVTNTPEAPVITSQPTSITVTEGASATFTVKATGKPAPAHQWMRNGTPIPGANQAQYTLENVGAADDKAIFSVQVSNIAGNAQSEPATLSVSQVKTFTVRLGVEGPGGSLQGDTEQVIPAGGSLKPVVAVAAPGYRFNFWVKNASQAIRGETFTLNEVNQDLTLIARFAKNGPAEAGQTAPDIAGMDQNGKAVALSDAFGRGILMAIFDGSIQTQKIDAATFASTLNLMGSTYNYHCLNLLLSNGQAQVPTQADLKNWFTQLNQPLLNLTVQNDASGVQGQAYQAYIKGRFSPCYVMIDANFKVSGIYAQPPFSATGF